MRNACLFLILLLVKLCVQRIQFEARVHVLTGQQNREHMQAPEGDGDDPEVCLGKTEFIHHCYSRS